MIRLQMTVADLERTRFAYSPLAEVAESLYLLSAKRIPPPHTAWFDAISRRLSDVDMGLLHAVVPAHATMASFLFIGAGDPATTIDSQLRQLAETPLEQIRSGLEYAWTGRELPAQLQSLLGEGSAGLLRLTEALRRYWEVAIEPYWRQIRAVLADDIAYRAGRLTAGGMAALFTDLHPELSFHGWEVRIDKPLHHIDKQLPGTGLTLIPSVFAWPNLVVVTRAVTQPNLTYACRGVGRLWGGQPVPRHANETLSELVGSSRAAILTTVGLPLCTTEIAAHLGQSAPSVNQHLGVLRRSGLVTSWRSGRRVLYQRTPLGDSVCAASLTT